MKKDSFSRFKSLLKNVKKVSIVTHWNPDGDAIGSSLALYHFLAKIGKKTTIIIPNSAPAFLNWMPGSARIINYEVNEIKADKIILSSDVLFTLDFNNFKRLEKLGRFLEKTSIPKVLIDHHQQPDNYATYYFHDTKACSTCELIYDLIEGVGGKKHIDKKIAACLYTGLMTDTGSFKYPSVTSRTHQIVGEILKTGILPNDIHSAVYDDYSIERIKLLGYALSEKMRLVKDLPVAYFTLSKEELTRFNYKKGDLEGIVNYPFSIKGIKVCALLNENDGIIKMSFRSKGKIDMNKFAKTYFNGGGHINAAGGKSNESLKTTEEKFVKLIKTIF